MATKSQIPYFQCAINTHVRNQQIDKTSMVYLMHFFFLGGVIILRSQILEHVYWMPNSIVFQNMLSTLQGGGTQYKRPYGNVPPTQVAKSASWYVNDPL